MSSPPTNPLSRDGGSSSEARRLAICVVTHNDAEDLPRCLEAVAALETKPLELVVVDCASGDRSLEALEGFAAPGVTVTAIPLAENLGFAGGMNRALAASRAPWVLSLNADAAPAPDYVERLLARAAAAEALGWKVGALTGRLVRSGSGSPDDEAPLLDACGMRWIPAWRHLDRGSGEPDRGQWSEADRVFGATGAASLFRRAALEDVAFRQGKGEGEIFDERFHSFREDAELAFRLRERGWEVLYEPAARALHRRFNLPERRSAMPREVNYHSLKNRYLLRAYHQTPGNLWRTLYATLPRDLLALGYVLLRERTSLAAYAYLWRHRRDILARRRALQARRTEPARSLDRWFFSAGLPLDSPPDR